MGEYHVHHDITVNNPGELKALLEFNFHHNASHIDELLQIADAFEKTGSPETGKKIIAAARIFANGNALLEEAIKSLE